MSKWISVDDSIPKESERVLAMFNGEHIVLELVWETPSHEETFKPFFYWCEPFREMTDIEWYEVSHWMPLPEIPVIKDEAA